MRKNLLAIIVALVCILVVSPMAFSYSDSVNHWAEKEISLLSAKEIINGYPDNTFRPNNPVTRAEFCSMLLGALHKKGELVNLKNLSSSFKDVKNNHWAKSDIEYCYELGLVSGYGDGKFQPESHITRTEITAILVRTLNLKSKTSKSLPFKDAQKIPNWARSSVKVAFDEGLVKGDTLGNFNPSGKTTRAEAAALITRVLEKRSDKYEYVGTLKEVDFKNKKLKIDFDGERITFEYTNLDVVYDGDKKISLESLFSRLPQDVFLILNKAGKVTYIEIVSSDYKKTSLKISGTEEDMPLLKNNIAQEKNKNISIVAEKEKFLSVYSDIGLQNARQSLNTTFSEIELPKLKEATGVSGRNQVVAIIDTGVDPGHPGIFNLENNDKILKWVDFTSEGVVKTTSVTNKTSTISTPRGNIRVGDIPSKTGKYRYGFLEESKLLRDLNFNGSLNDSFFVLVTAENSSVYDTVYIDTDGDGSLEDEEPLKVFNREKKFFSFPESLSGEVYNFVVANIEKDGSEVHLSTDLNGHGTHIAGIVTANGEIKGIAPDSKLLVVKALDSNGETDWKTLHDAIRYAAENGADVINLSLGYYEDKTAGNNSLTSLISEMTKRYGVIFTVATGNTGPGVSTVATPGNALDAISVGGYVSSKMWKQIYGWDVSGDSLLYFSSVGPRKDGLNVPTIVAPGSVISTSPLWDYEKYYFSEGTSVAAPYAAGSALLLKESMEKIGRTVTPFQIKKAFEVGARKMSGFQGFEVGSGALDVFKAWQYLLTTREIPELEVKNYDIFHGFGRGIYARNYVPGLIYFEVTNKGTKESSLTLEGTSSLINLDAKRVRIPPGGKRNIQVEYNIPSKPGIYSAYLKGNLVNGNLGGELLSLSTVVVPYTFEKENNNKVKFTDTSPAAQYKRSFFEIPDGVQEFKIKIKVLEEGVQAYKGRVRLHLFDPSGKEQEVTPYIGLAPLGTISQGSAEITIKNPQKGTWEAVVYSSPSISEFGLTQSDFEIECSIKGGISHKDEGENYNKWLIGYVPLSTSPDTLVIHVRDKNTKRKVDGMLKIEGKHYQIKDGIVQINFKK